MKRQLVWLLSVCGMLSAIPFDLRAAQVTYHFSSTVNEVIPSAPGFPASLSGVQVGDPFSGTISYSTTSPATTNPSGGVYAQATFYSLNSATVSFNVGGVPLNTWTGTPSAFVWNNDMTQPATTTTYDGLMYANSITTAEQPLYLIGSLILPTSTFANETLPTGNVSGFHGAYLGTGIGDVWVQSNNFTLSVIMIPPGDFDSDGDVDGADFVAWQTNFPKASGATPAQGDADGDGDVDGADFIVWQTNFPFTPGPGASPVPEPASIFMFSTCAILMTLWRTCRFKIK